MEQPLLNVRAFLSQAPRRKSAHRNRALSRELESSGDREL
jgi:hypothetical protein